MKDIAKLLKEHAPKPTQSLPANFTRTVTVEINSGSHKPGWGHWLHLSRAGALATLAIVLISGTAAAVTLWPRPTVTPTITQKLPSGNHIIGYDATNCNYFSAPDNQAPTRDKLYYEVKEGSKFTDEQLKDSVRAVCEENISDNAITRIVKQLPKDLPGMQSTAAYTIEAIGKDSITVSLDSHYDSSKYALVAHQTYTRFASNLIVSNEGNDASFGDLKVGDTIKMIVQDTSGKSSESPEGWFPLNHPESIKVLALLKIPALTGDPTLFYSAVAQDLVRLDPCDSSPTGFCRAYDFVQQ